MGRGAEGIIAAVKGIGHYRRKLFITDENSQSEHYVQFMNSTGLTVQLLQAVQEVLL